MIPRIESHRIHQTTNSTTIFKMNVKYIYSKNKINFKNHLKSREFLIKAEYLYPPERTRERFTIIKNIIKINNQFRSENSPINADHPYL